MTNILPAIDGITIRQHNGLFSLTDLHRASGGEDRHQPSNFTRREETKALVCEIAQSSNLRTASQAAEIGHSANSQSALQVINGGNNKGTYACRELVIAYAAWISPAFHLKVIRVFLDAAAPKPEPLPPLPYKEQPGQSLSEPQCAELRAMLTGGSAQVPENVRGQFMVQGWSRLKAHFGCTYRHIPAARFEEARDIIARHIAAFLPQPALGLDPFDAQAMNAARKAAIDWFCGKQATPDNIPPEVLQGLVAQALMSRRFLLDFSLWRGRWEAGIITLDPHDCIINYDTTSCDTIAENTPRHRIPDLIAALARRAAPLLAAPQAA